MIFCRGHDGRRRPPGSCGILKVDGGRSCPPGIGHRGMPLSQERGI
ncbi:hypothetical protein KCP76_24640 [Salmonella enterica subsp. enterica serovar Weltevreden]|nr:hypothetical protein KCP76_24640 [Salmonella enterica subsp. enterica serovar Weltevreden]